MMSGFKASFDCIKAFSETDFTEDLKKFDVPTLIVHGDDDQIVPIDASARLSAKLVKNSVLKIYAGGSDAQKGADAIAAAWEKITDQIGRENQIALYKASLGL